MSIQGLGGRQIISYLPRPFAVLRSYQALAGAEQPEVNQLWDDLSASWDGLYITTATDPMLGRWEAIVMGEAPPVGSSDDERRFDLLTKTSLELPYSIRMLEQLIARITGDGGYSIEISPSSYFLEIRIALVSQRSLKEVDRMLRRVLPANMAYHLDLKYNRHSMLTAYTHGQLCSLTHYEIRQEVLP